MTTEPNPENLCWLAAGLKLLILDVDGVMTDGGIILIGPDIEAKRFDVQDGMAINLIRTAGLKTAILTSRNSEVVQRRATELKIDEVIQGASDKVKGLEILLEKYSLLASESAYIGDDLQDIPVMSRVGIPIAVQNAVQTVKDRCLYVTQAPGGHGAVREAVEWLMELRGDKDSVYKVVAG